MSSRQHASAGGRAPDSARASQDPGSRAMAGPTTTVDEIDELLDEIDAVLEEQSVLTNFRQRSGQ